MTLSTLTFAYNDTPLFSDLTLTLPKTGAICLCGASGCGKTTLLRLLCGLETPQKGNCIGLPRRPAVVFQENRLLPWKTAAQNVALVLFDTQNADARAREVLTAVGLSDEEQNRLPRMLSGGQCRRVALARALALQDSDALFLDEPFTGLDEDRVDAIAALLREAARHKPLLLITHDEQDAARLNAPLWRLENGRLLTSDN